MDASRICAVFDRCFAAPGPRAVDRARMVRGGDEPLFLPAGRGRAVAEVVYARGLPPSCLHEAAHWLIAGSARRALVDYGYWYVPDGRDQDAQRRFEQVEVAVQALESLLAAAAGVRFTLSCDNLTSTEPSRAFVAAVAHERACRVTRMSARMHRFAAALRQERARNDHDRLAIRAAAADTSPS